ncbi:MAG: hypothetical protein E5W82_24210 [Mesorhizobium sp.]|nr:MAG: hypothetical protein E5W82_24210 [Mesorhizobium sp.]
MSRPESLQAYSLPCPLEIGEDRRARNLPPSGGDVRQDRGGAVPPACQQIAVVSSDRFPSGLNCKVGDPSRPPLPCRASPPQGGRLAVTNAFAFHT